MIYRNKQELVCDVIKKCGLKKEFIERIESVGLNAVKGALSSLSTHTAAFLLNEGVRHVAAVPGIPIFEIVGALFDYYIRNVFFIV